MNDRAHSAKRVVELATNDLRSDMLGLIQWSMIAGVNSGDGSAPTATTDEDEAVQVYEPYGFASAPPGPATALIFAPGGEQSHTVALPLSSPSGRPATDAGDSVVYSAAGHQVVLDDDDTLTITSKDGAKIVLDADGNIDVDPAPGAKVRLGGAAANLPVARVTDTTVADVSMTTWIAAMQTAGVAVAAFFGLPLPIAPTDFGVIDSGSDEVEST